MKSDDDETGDAPEDVAKMTAEGAHAAAAEGADAVASPIDEGEAIDPSLAAGRERVLHAQQEAAQQLSPAARALAGIAAEPGVPKPDPILVADQVSRRFGGLTAVDVHRLEVQRGTITALIGPNGAGKSTFFNLVSGFDKPTSGRWSFNGRDITGMSAYRIARLGMVRTFQLTKALTRMTALENMMLGATGQRGERFLPSLLRPSWKGQEKTIEARADDLLRRFNLAHMRDDFAGTMSGGQRKLLEMARAMMVDPALIMLDEPTAALADTDIDLVHKAVLRLASEGNVVLYITHRLNELEEICDAAVVLRNGRLADAFPIKEASMARIVHAMIGRELDELYPGVPTRDQSALPAPVARLKGVATRGIASPIDLDLRPGEIVAACAQLGSGFAWPLRSTACLRARTAGALSSLARLKAPAGYDDRHPVAVAALNAPASAAGVTA